MPELEKQTSELLLTEQEEDECVSVIETIIMHANKIAKHNEAIGMLLWQLKYRLLGEDGKVVSKKFQDHLSSVCDRNRLSFRNLNDRVSFNEVCRWLNDMGLFESTQALFMRVWAYEQRVKVQEDLGVDISGLKVSDHTLMELRKVPEQHQREVLETAIHNIADGRKITGKHIQQAKEMVFSEEFQTPYIKLPQRNVRRIVSKPEAITLTKKQLDDLLDKAVKDYQTIYKEELIGLKVEFREQAKEEALREVDASKNDEIRFYRQRSESLYKKLQQAQAEIQSLRKSLLEQGIQLAS